MSRRKKFKGKQPWVGKTLAHRLKGIEDMYDANAKKTWPANASWNKRSNSGIGFYRDGVLGEVEPQPMFSKELLARATLPDADNKTAERVEDLFTYPRAEVCEDGVYVVTKDEADGLTGVVRIKVVSEDVRKANGLQVGEQLDEFKVDWSTHDEPKVSFRRRNIGSR